MMNRCSPRFLVHASLYTLLCCVVVFQYGQYHLLRWTIGCAEDNINIYDSSLNGALSSTTEEAVDALLYVHLYYPRGDRYSGSKDSEVTPLIRVVRKMVTRSIIESIKKKTEDSQEPFAIYSAYIRNNFTDDQYSDSEWAKLTEMALYQEMEYWVKKYGNADAQIRLQEFLNLLLEMYGTDKTSPSINDRNTSDDMTQVPRSMRTSRPRSNFFAVFLST